jgi:hypothetical protein
MVNEPEKENGEEIFNSSLELEGLSEKETRQITELMQEFVRAYENREASDTTGKWLEQKLSEELPGTGQEEIRAMADEIMESVNQYDRNLREIDTVCEAGKEKETWFVKKVSQAAEAVSITEFGNYLNGIDTALSNANAQMARTVMTKAGTVSQCRNLDGFIAEQYAVNSFNEQAKLTGSKYVAEVKVPEPGETYGLNSFDTVIRDSTTGKTVHQYQFKFGKDAKSTISLLKKGNYNNQRFVVPEGQVEAVREAFPGKSVEAFMGGTEKVPVKSAPLTKETAKQMQLEVQNGGELKQYDWNIYNTKELAVNIGKNAGRMGMQAALITTGFELVEKTVQGQEISADEAVETALTTGIDTGLKQAVAGALKVGTEKGVIVLIPKGTPAGVIAGIACMSIENAKILLKVSKGELELSQGIDCMGRTSLALVGGLALTATGAAVGASLLGWIPIAGPLIGGIVGGMAGYMAGSKVGSAIYSGAKKVGSAVKSAAGKVWGGVKSAGSRIASGIKSAAGKIFGR